MFSSLPSMWSAVRLRDISEDIERIDPASLGEGSFKYVDISSIDNKNKEIIDTSVISNKQAPSRARQIIEKDDILVSTVRPNLNAVAIVPKELDSAICSTGFCVLRPITSKVIPEYLFVWVTNVYFVAMMTRLARGIGYPAVTDRDVYNSLIPLPPLPEQQRIVEILKQADALRRQRREILDQVIASKEVAFYEMFGVLEKGENKVPLTELAEINAPLRDVELEGDTLVSFVPMSAIDETTGKITGLEVKCYSEVKTGYTPFQEGDVLFAKITPCMENGKAAIASGLENGIGFGSTEYHVLRPINGCTSEFLLGIVRRAEFRELARRFFIGTSGHQRVAESFLKNHRIAVPEELALKAYSDFVFQADTLYENGEQQAEIIEELDAEIKTRAFIGELTETWREAHREELEAWLREHPECLPKKSTRVTNKETVPAERQPPARPERHWLMEQLSETQSAVYLALQEWKGTLIPSEDLDSFLNEGAIEHLEDAHDQIRRALNQLAGLGLVAKVSLPNDQGEYVTGYRMLREDELSKADDLERLWGAA